MITKSEEQVIAEMENRLAVKFTGVPPAEVASVIAQARNIFANSQVRDFIPLLVERRATDELVRQLAGAVPVGV